VFPSGQRNPFVISFPICTICGVVPCCFSALSTLNMRDYLSGLFKTPFFGAIIALVGCHFGMTTRGGTAGVGNSTTRTVVVISITILIADFWLTKIAILAWPQV
jgi:phospholipid/cholesterol/gamma-HCH transport system permease protein